jgi:hypothetical protein
VKRTFIHQVSEISVKPKGLHKTSAPTSKLWILELFHIKFMFFSFSFHFNHFTLLACEIFYARKVDLFDKIKEVVFSQLFRV